MNPSQSSQPFPAVESYFNRAANGGLTCWYSGAANQTTHGTQAFAAALLWAKPVILDGGILDTVAFELTAGGAGSLARVGIYKNTSENLVYPGALVVDAGEYDTSGVAAVKATTGLSIPIPPDLYWLVYTCQATAPTIRSIVASAHGHMLGAPTTISATLNTVITVARAYQALPATFPAGAALAAGSVSPLVAWHYAS